MSNPHPINTLKQLIQQSRFDEAIAIAQPLVDSPDESDAIEALYMQAVAFRLSGQSHNAIKTLDSLLARRPDHARAYQEKGYVLQANGDSLDAASGFYRATQLNPALISAWKALVPIYKKQGNTQAHDLALEQIKYLSALPRPILGAQDLMYEGKLNTADKVCRQFLQQHKHQQDAMLCLAQIGIRMKVYGEAEFLLESCVELYPTFLPAILELLTLYAKQGKFASLLQRIEGCPDSFKAHPQVTVAKANALVGIGQLDEAIKLYQVMLDKAPQLYAINLLLGHAYKAAGDLEKAVTQYQSAYTNREDVGDAYWSLANTKTYQFSESEVKQMKRQVGSNQVAVEDRIHFAFALGKAFEDRKDFDESFFYYELGNRLKLDVSGYDIERTEAYIERITEQFKPSLFDQFTDVGHQDNAPIFIVGLPRAGSTLLEQILASHSQVDGTMELHNILGLAARLQKRGYPGELNSLSPEYFTRFGEQFINDTKAYRQSAPYFIDKMPNNFMHIGLIKLILPNAKIIDARREAMACCFSGFKQLFGEGQEFSYGLESIGRYYKAYEKLMEHWNNVLPGFVLKVQHENVVNDLEGQVHRILKFCGLPFEQSCVDFYKTKRAVKTPSSEQVRQPIYRSGLEQWKYYEKHLSSLVKIIGKA